MENVMGSREVARAALTMCMSRTRDEEYERKAELRQQGILSAAVDYGGEFISSMTRMVERVVVAAKREGVINDSHLEEGAVAGAAREALVQVMNKALGLNVGGKLAIARNGDHLAVAVFFGIGLLHLNEVAVGLGHRVV